MKKTFLSVVAFMFLLSSFFMLFSPVKAQSIRLDSVSSHVNDEYVNPAGQVGNTVWLRGSGFGSTQGSGSVRCLLHYADKLTGQLNRTTTLTWPASSWSDTLILATVPAFFYPGTCEVSVRNDYGEQSNTKVFTVFFTLYSMTPNSAKEGETVTITGNFMGYGFGTNGGGWPNASVYFTKKPEYIRSYFIPVSWTPTRIVARVVAPSGVSLPVTGIVSVAIPNGFLPPSYLEMAAQDLTINPALTPTPTIPIQTPTSPLVCPLKLSSETGSLKYTFNNEWKHYVSFTPSVAGKVDKVSVKVGNWGNALRSVSCKVTNNSGQNMSIEKSSAAFTSSSGAQWRDISFKSNPFNLQINTQYRLYCKGPDSWGSLYWVYNQSNNPNSKTYRIYMCL